MADVQTDRNEAVGNCINVRTAVRDCYIKDVTSEYFGENTIAAEVDNPTLSTVMLGVFSPSGWRVVDYAVESGKRKAVFKNVEPGAVYIPLAERGGKGRTEPCGYPFVYGKDLSVSTIKPGDRRCGLRLVRKIPFMPWLYEWFSQGVGGD